MEIENNCWKSNIYACMHIMFYIKRRIVRWEKYSCFKQLVAQNIKEKMISSESTGEICKTNDEGENDSPLSFHFSLGLRS